MGDDSYLPASVSRAHLEGPSRHGVEAFDHRALWKHVSQELSVRRPVQVDPDAVAHVDQRLSSQCWLQFNQSGVVLRENGDKDQVCLAGCFHL